jgi:uncharacterized protein YndB with AHSA1/START domain
MALKFQVQLKIRKPAAEVFDAVVDPKKLSGYFVQEATAPLVAGTVVKWKFPELPDFFDVVVREVVPHERIVLEWETGEGFGYNSRIEMAFKPIDAANTMVQITESGWREDEKGLAQSHGNAGGWMHMMACMKASLEYGINLRAGGAF